MLRIVACPLFIADRLQQLRHKPLAFLQKIPHLVDTVKRDPGDLWI